MRLLAKTLALLIVAGATSPLCAGTASAAPASPCITRQCISSVSHHGPNGETVTQCLEWKTTTRGDCAVHVKPDLLPPDLLRPKSLPNGSPRQTR